MILVELLILQTCITISGLWDSGYLTQGSMHKYSTKQCYTPSPFLFLELAMQRLPRTLILLPQFLLVSGLQVCTTALDSHQIGNSANNIDGSFLCA